MGGSTPQEAEAVKSQVPGQPGVRGGRAGGVQYGEVRGRGDNLGWGE
jgi:hypothetical protein